MTTKIKWRLANRPEVEEIALLVKEGLLTKDEAREILFSLETEEDRDKKSLQEEIKFLREVAQRMATKHTSIVETIRYVEKPFSNQPWYSPYQAWCATADLTSSSNTTLISGSSGNNSLNNIALASAGMSTIYLANSGEAGSITSFDYSTQPEFKDIQTF